MNMEDKFDRKLEVFGSSKETKNKAITNNEKHMKCSVPTQHLSNYPNKENYKDNMYNQDYM